jgi:hypothetical protein
VETDSAAKLIKSEVSEDGAVDELRLRAALRQKLIEEAFESSEAKSGAQSSDLSRRVV